MFGLTGVSENTCMNKTSSHLCCHDEAGGSRVDGDVTGHQPHILELLIHLSVLLVGQGLDWAGEDDSLLLSESQCYGISERRAKQVRPVG